MYILGTKIKQILKHKLLFNEIKCILTFPKNKTSLLVIYGRHKTSAAYTQRWPGSCENRKRCSERKFNTATADRQRPDHCVCNKANALVFPLTQWRQLHWDPELWVGCWGKRPWTILRHDSGRCLEGIWKISEIYLEQCPGRESNSVYPAYETPL